MLTGTNLTYTKAHNQRIVLETIRLFGPISRKEIAERTELAPQSISNISRALIESELVVESERVQQGRGAPSIPLALNPTGAFSIGLDFDREHFTGVLVDLSGTVVSQVRKEVSFLQPDEAVKLMIKSVQRLVGDAGIAKSRVWGVGVGLPGPLGISEGSVVTNLANPVEFPGWSNVPIAEMLSGRLGLSVLIENNASAAAAGERWYGRGRHIRDFFYLYFGVGLGGGFVLDGRPFDGHNGNAGEVGAIRTTSGHDSSTGLKNPHLGDFFSVINLSRQLSLHGIVVSRPEHLGELFDQANSQLVAWLDRGIAQLAPFVYAVECLIDPEAIILGGRYSESMIQYIKDRLDKTLATLRADSGRTHPPLFCGTAGEDATALGAATLPMFSSFAPAPDVLLKNGPNDSLSTRIQQNS